MDNDKVKIRKDIKQKWSQLSFEGSTSLEQTLCSTMASLFKCFNPSEISYIGAFSPLSDEPQWSNAFKGLNFQFAYPECLSTKKMVFRHAKDRELLVREIFQSTIKEPSKQAVEVIPDLILVPGLAFDLKGNRLGRGKGFYDRYLKDFDGLTIGVCYEFQLVEDLPVFEHDQAVDALITDKKIYNISKRLNSFLSDSMRADLKIERLL